MKRLVVAFLLSAQVCLARIALPDLSTEGIIKQTVGSRNKPG